jgi:hypothetical protein
MRHRPRPRWLIAGFALALALALSFAGHALWTVTHLRKASAPVESWMTPGYVLHTFRIAPEALATALGVDPGTARGRTLEEIAADRGIPPQALIATIQALVAP